VSVLSKIGLGVAALLLVGGVIAGSSMALRAKKEPSAPSAGGPRGSGAAGAPVPVDVFVVTPRPFEVTVPASGTLIARESVELVSELPRRLAKVRAEEGATVKKGQVLFDLDSSDLSARARTLNVQKNLAKTTLERVTKLHAQGVASQSELETAQSKLDEIEAERRVIGVDLGKARIKAPFAGTLGLRRVSEGAWVSSNTVLTTLHDTSQLKIDFSLPERYASLKLIDKPFRFKVAGRGETFHGKIVAVEGTVQKQSRSVLVRGLIEDPKGLTPGTFAEVEIPLRAEQALHVPTIAVTPGTDGQRVFRVIEGKVDVVKVELGDRGDKNVQVLSGLAPGDKVIVSNLLRVRPGGSVSIVNEGRP
jgi:membrane fusion protein (multidrug efflux system)